MATRDWPERLWIVRHGQSAGNVARDAAETGKLILIELDTRDADVPLSELGHRQAFALARWFADMPRHHQPEQFYVSPFERARQTCQAVTDRIPDAGEPCVDERLREKEFGILDRYTRHGIIAKFPELAEQRRLVGKFYFRPPGGESWCDVILRLRSVLEMLRRDAAGKRVLIVSHQVIVNCFRYLLEHLDERAILDIDAHGDVPNCGIVEYVRGRDAMEVVRANATQPLDQTDVPVTCASDTPRGPR
jgi:broad specificity phosphatase PhoE